MNDIVNYDIASGRNWEYKCASNVNSVDIDIFVNLVNSKSNADMDKIIKFHQLCSMSRNGIVDNNKTQKSIFGQVEIKEIFYNGTGQKYLKYTIFTSINELFINRKTLEQVKKKIKAHFDITEWDYFLSKSRRSGVVLTDRCS